LRIETPFEIKSSPASRASRNLPRRTSGNNGTAFFSRSGAHVDDIVAGYDDVKIVLHDNHRVAKSNQPIELRYQSLNIRRMESSSRFVKYIQGVSALVALQFRRQLDTLRFASR
jgi:hypothetical protein